MKVNVNFTTSINLKNIYCELDLLASKKEIQKAIREEVNNFASETLCSGNQRERYLDEIIIYSLIERNLAKLKENSQYR